MAAPAAPPYDRTYLTDPTKVRSLATWILDSDELVAVRARSAMAVLRNFRPTEESLKMVYRYLFNTDDGTLVMLIRAYSSSRSTRRR